MEKKITMTGNGRRKAILALKPYTQSPHQGISFAGTGQKTRGQLGSYPDLHGGAIPCNLWLVEPAWNDIVGFRL